MLKLDGLTQQVTIGTSVQGAVRKAVLGEQRKRNGGGLRDDGAGSNGAVVTAFTDTWIGTTAASSADPLWVCTRRWNDSFTAASAVVAVACKV